jgi:hypothetical protein
LKADEREAEVHHDAFPGPSEIEELDIASEVVINRIKYTLPTAGTMAWRILFHGSRHGSAAGYASGSGQQFVSVQSKAENKHCNNSRHVVTVQQG